MNAAVSSPAAWQEGFLRLLPAIQTHARIQFRRLPAVQKEEAIQEAIAAACMSYQKLAAAGRLHVAYPSTLANYSVRHVRLGRHVGGRQDTIEDVLSPATQRLGRVQVHSVESEEGMGGWKELAIADRRASIPDLAAFRIDFARWLRTLTRRDRRIIAALVSGEKAKVVGRRLGISEGRVSQIRRRYQREWAGFQGEVAGRAA